MPGFDVMAEAYDAMINWERRLANEAPLLRWVFERVGARSVLDAACGSGRHAAMFASWGLRTQGADVSGDMVDWCRRTHGESGNLSWAVRSFTQKAEAMWDVVICTGNSLALAEDPDTITQALSAMAQSVSPSGALVLHVVNVYSRPEGPVQWDKALRVKLSRGEHLLHKGIHRCGSRGYVDFVLTSLSTFEVVTRSVPFAGLQQGWLGERMRQCGFTHIDVFGGYGRQGFDGASSGDLIVVAVR